MDFLISGPWSPVPKSRYLSFLRLDEQRLRPMLHSGAKSPNEVAPMRFLRLVLLPLLAIALAPAAMAEYKLVNEPDPADPMAVSIYELSNGLQVHLTENHESPRFYAEISVRAGSKMDPAESTGLAHYLEHLLFKGTQKLGTLNYEQERVHMDKIAELYQQHFNETDPEKRAGIYAQINEESVLASAFTVPNEMDRIYSAMGATDLNAHTWHEETVYKVGLPANRLEHWALLESERFVNPVFRLFQTELETVYEEMNRTLDNKERLIGMAVEKQVFKQHPYGQQPTIGTVEHLKNPSLKNILDYFNTFYVPNNMAIMISGDIQKDQAIQVIDKYFSGWQRKELPAAKTWDEPALQGREFLSVNFPGEEKVVIEFRTAAKLHEDAEPLLLLDMILDNANAGLINLNLNQQQRVRQAGASPSQYNDYGTEELWGIPKEGQTLEEVEKLLLEQIELVKQGKFEDWLLPAIITDYKKMRKAGLEADESRVAMMRDAWIAHEDWPHAVAQIDRMEKLTKEDVVRVANRYFGENFVVGYRRDAAQELPKIVKPPLAALEIDPTRQSDFGKQVLALPFEPIEPEFVQTGKDYQKTDFAEGIQLYHAPNPINDLFTFSINIEFGTFEDNKISTAAALLNKSGTQKFSAEELKKEWYKLGTDFGIGAGDNETTLSLSGLDENFEASIGLLMDLMRTPSAPEETLSELKNIILVERADAKKQVPSIAAAVVQYNRFGQESVFLRALPAEELKALTVEQLHAVTRGLLDYKHVISYTGSKSMDEVVAALKKFHDADKQLKDPPPYRYLRARAPEATEIYFFSKEAAQANIRLELGTIDYNEALYPAIELYNSYFAGGMAGIVFQELREARALAYSAGARYLPGYRAKDQDLMLGAIQSQADKTAEATAAFVELLDKLPVSEERFAMAKDSLINEYRTGKISFRGVIDAVRAWERHGLEPDPRQQRFEAIQQATLQTVLDFHAAQIGGKPKLVSIVGDGAKIDQEQLKTLGTIKPVTLEEIFVD